MSSSIQLIVGLGNPGLRYAWTRHNLGFLALDALSSQTTPAFSWKEKFGGLWAKEHIAHQTCAFLKPMEFMNLSGQATQKAAAFLSLTPDQILVVHDEADLPEGQLRLKKGGGAGGHNGLRSLIGCLGSGDFYRLRVGTGKHPQMDLAAFMLSKASPDLLAPLAEEAAKAIVMVLSQGFRDAQQTLHRP
jgi:PTH1 family peptidyl-tRNA hydrolase